MQMLELVRKFGRNDVKLISRDHFLVMMFFFVVLIAIVLRFGLPWLNGHLAKSGVLPNDSVAKSLSDYFPMLLAFFVIFQGPLIAGAIFGFSLLDEKEDNTIKAMLVTPVPFGRYVMYRISVPTVISFLIVVFMMLFINQSLVPLWQLILIAAGASFTGPIAALFYAVTAENKVQGFAVAKFIGLAGWVILLGWFVTGPWQWLFGLFPPFLISKAYWMALTGDNLWPVALVFGIVLQAGLLGILAKRFNKVAYS
jgi:fluoroquinolone transport system permease protein